MIQIVDSHVQQHQRRDTAALQLAGQLFTRLGDSGVRYCQWKSNQGLAAALTGEGDLDLLIHAEDTDRFQAIIAELGFKLCAQPAWQSQPSVVHYYGCDGPTGRFLHLHVYYRLVSGGHVLKNFRLPLERLLLTQSHQQHGVVVPDRAAELLVFVVRKMLEAGGWCELALQRRDLAHLRRELEWLLPSTAAQREELLGEVTRSLASDLPQLSIATWRAGVECLTAPTSLVRQFAIGRRFRRQLGSLALHGPIASQAIVAARAVRLVSQRLRHVRSRKWLAQGGRVVAIVGPEASGKTTLAQSLCDWLAPTLATHAVHMGKPSATWLGRCANTLRRLRSRVAGRHKGSNGEPAGECSAAERKITLAYVIASILLARDRYHAAAKAYRRASRGAIVICDRYPSLDQGAIDGPRLPCSPETVRRSWLYRLATRLEHEYYRRLPRPDVMVQLTVPVSIAQIRNQQRVKPDKESDAYLAQRHQQFHAGGQQYADCTQVDTTRPPHDVLAQLKRIVWGRVD